MLKIFYDEFKRVFSGFLKHEENTPTPRSPQPPSRFDSSFAAREENMIIEKVKHTPDRPKLTVRSGEGFMRETTFTGYFFNEVKPFLAALFGFFLLVGLPRLLGTVLLAALQHQIVLNNTNDWQDFC